MVMLWQLNLKTSIHNLHFHIVPAANYHTTTRVPSALFNTYNNASPPFSYKGTTIIYGKGRLQI